MKQYVKVIHPSEIEKVEIKDNGTGIEYEKLSGGKRKIAASELDNYTGHVFDGVRYMYQEELEKCQCVPDGYTKCLTRNEAADVLGDGWNIDVIKWFFSGLKRQ